MADIVKPDDFAVGRIEERDMEAGEVEGILCGTSGISLGLSQGVLRTECPPLCFDDPKDAAIDAEGIVRRAIIRLVFLDAVRS